jgi:hypothetical protein
LLISLLLSSGTLPSLMLLDVIYFNSGVIIFLLLLAGGITCVEGSVFNLNEPTAEWMAVQETLMDSGRIRSSFEETRSNPFHRHALRFDGTIYWDAKLGLSIQYENPSPVVVNITEDSMYVTRAGETSKHGSEADQGRVMSLFSKLFSWDIEWLSNNFTTEGEIGENSNWSLKLVPVNEELAGFVSILFLEGNATYLTKIAMNVRGGRIINIALSNQEYQACFSDEEMRKAFPYTHD